MIGLTDHQRAVLDTITDRDAAHPVTGKEIAGIIGLKPRASGKDGADLRSIVNALRCKGYPICATDKGYFWPKDRVEAEAYAKSLEGRVQAQQEALDGFRLGIAALGAGKGHFEAQTAKPVAYQTGTGVVLVAVNKIEAFLAAYPDAKKI